MPRGKRRPALPVTCPEPGHASSSVVRNGVRTVRGAAYQRYRCVPTNGDRPHTLRSEVPVAGVPAPAPPSPAEPCPNHPGSKVVRDGRSRSKAGVERQMFRCYPSDGSRSHRYQPPLTRLVVNHGETCPTCAALRGVNTGDTTAARGHRYTTRIVVAALGALASGDSYGSVSSWSRDQLTALHQHSDELVVAGSNTTSKQRRNSWRLAADWTETFSPVLWEPWAAAARAEVLEVMSGPVKDRPVVSLLLDDLPIYAKSRDGVRQRQRFAVLAASESFVDRNSGTRITRLRLLRAYPDHTTEAYKLVLAELGYVPDIILSDGGPGIGGAVRALRAANPGKPFLTALSAYHLRKQLLRQFSDLAKPYGFQPGDLISRLEDWSFCESAHAWRVWWSDYETRLRAQGIPETAWPRKWIRQIKPVVDAQMEALDEDEVVPRSTGNLEATLFRVVKPSLTGRAQGFGNLTRTNRLLDLMTLRANGAFDNPAALIEQLNADARHHDGYLPVVRQVTDVRSYRSLVDDEVPERLVKELGL